MFSVFSGHLQGSGEGLFRVTRPARLSAEAAWRRPLPIEKTVTCSNCDERIVAVFVMVRKLRRSHANAGCAFCGDPEAVTRLMNSSVDTQGRKQPLLLDVKAPS